MGTNSLKYWRQLLNTCPDLLYITLENCQFLYKMTAPKIYHKFKPKIPVLSEIKRNFEKLCHFILNQKLNYFKHLKNLREKGLNIFKASINENFRPIFGILIYIIYKSVHNLATFRIEIFARNSWTQTGNFMFLFVFQKKYMRVKKHLKNYTSKRLWSNWYIWQTGF